MAMMVAPTKSGLIKAKSSLALSNKGFELLDKKRNVLIREMMELVNKSRNIREKVYSTIAEAYQALQEANITMGFRDVDDITNSIPADEDFEILLKSVMGAEIPSVRYKRKEIEPAYGFYNSNISLDIARQKFNEVRYGIYELAELENSIFKLAKEIEKTSKRTNALQHIQIPKYSEQVKRIQEVLEEKEREDYFRLKWCQERQSQ
ncbi:MAG TPA: V-type ATP synthase subunit D [Clostridia bacterium]